MPESIVYRPVHLATPNDGEFIRSVGSDADEAKTIKHVF